MRNRRLTIFALAAVLMAGCGEDRGLNPELVNLVGSWAVQSMVFTSVATPGLTEDALSAAGGVDELTLYMYDDGTLLTITFFTDPMIDPTYDLETFEVYATGDLLSGNLFSQRGPGTADPGVNAALVADVEAACGSAAPVNADGDATSPCDVFVVDLGETTQSAATFVQNGDDITINGTDMYDFGTGAEAATFVLDMDRFELDNDRGPLIGDNQGQL